MRGYRTNVPGVGKKEPIVARAGSPESERAANAATTEILVKVRASVFLILAASRAQRKATNPQGQPVPISQSGFPRRAVGLLAIEIGALSLNSPLQKDTHSPDRRDTGTSRMRRVGLSAPDGPAGDAALSGPKNSTPLPVKTGPYTGAEDFAFHPKLPRSKPREIKRQRNKRRSKTHNRLLRRRRAKSATKTLAKTEGWRS